MTEPPLRLPQHLLPRPKAAATSSSTSLDALGVTPPHPTSRSSSRTRPAPIQSPTSSSITPQDVSPKVTAALVRRVLVPNSSGTGTTEKPIEELLPPLTSSNEVDLQLYAIIAIVMKEFVYSWYGKITPDQTFVEEVVRIIAHCTRALEQRLRALDMESLVFDEIPGLVESHVRAFRTSREPLRPGPLKSDARLLYHTLVPHPALSPVPTDTDPSSIEDQSQNETAYRQLLVQGVLAVLLPTEDLGNACLRTLVADIFGEMILGNGVGGKACEGWLIWEGIANVAGIAKAHIEPKVAGEEIEVDTRSRLEKFGLLSTNNGSGAGQGAEGDERAKGRFLRSSMASEVFWRVLQYGYLAFITLRFVVYGFMAASSSSSSSFSSSSTNHRTKATTSNTSPVDLLTSSLHAKPIPDEKDTYGKSSKVDRAATSPKASARRPLLSFRIFALLALLLDLPERMPWLAGALSFVRYQLVEMSFALLRVGATDGILNVFLSNLLTTHILTPSVLPRALLNIRTTLFPHNSPAPARAIPSPTQQLAIKRRCALAILDVVPQSIASRFLLGSAWQYRDEESYEEDHRGSSSLASSMYSIAVDEGKSPTSMSASMSASTSLGTSSLIKDYNGREVDSTHDTLRQEAMVRKIESVLDMFGDSYCNKHLVYGIVELVIVRLVPELAEAGVKELMERRLGEESD
ncbi:hypothetical protein MMC25_000790 [Agyrium rufum]|nr:hypothetical protein [Agyrium rufum]